MPFTHAILAVFNFITNNPRLQLDAIKAFCAFGGMILMLNLIAQVSWCIYFFPQPFLWKLAGHELRSAMIWLEVEWCVFVGTLFSNALFIALRTCMRHKI